MSTENYGPQFFALVKKLTESDGDITRQERSWLRFLKKELGNQNESDFNPALLKEAVSNAEESEELIQLLLMVSLADGQTTPAELKLIKEVADLVGVDEAKLEELRSQTVLAVEP